MSEEIQIKDFKGKFLTNDYSNFYKKEDVVFKNEYDRYHPAKRYVLKAKEYYSRDVDYIFYDIKEKMEEDCLPSFKGYNLKCSEEKEAKVKEAMLDLMYDMLQSNEFYIVDGDVNVVENFDLVKYLQKRIKIKNFEYGQINFYFAFDERGDLTIAREQDYKTQGIKYFELLGVFEDHYYMNIADIRTEFRNKKVTYEQVEEALNKMEEI